MWNKLYDLFILVKPYKMSRYYIFLSRSMKSIVTYYNNLCTPAHVYLAISLIAWLVIASQNLGSNQMYCIGSYQCPVQNTMLIFLIKLVSILFWTWILNLMCKSGASMVAWILVLAPFVIMSITIISFMTTTGSLSRIIV